MKKIKEKKLIALNKQIDFIKNKVDSLLFKKAKKIFEQNNLLLLSQGKYYFEIDDVSEIYSVFVDVLKQLEDTTWRFETKCNCKSKEFCSHQLAVLFSLRDEIKEEQKNNLKENNTLEKA